MMNNYYCKEGKINEKSKNKETIFGSSRWITVRGGFEPKNCEFFVFSLFWIQANKIVFSLKSLSGSRKSCSKSKIFRWVQIAFLGQFSFYQIYSDLCTFLHAFISMLTGHHKQLRRLLHDHVQVLPVGCGRSFIFNFLLGAVISDKHFHFVICMFHCQSLFLSFL